MVAASKELRGLIDSVSGSLSKRHKQVLVGTVLGAGLIKMYMSYQAKKTQLQEQERILSSLASTTSDKKVDESANKKKKVAVDYTFLVRVTRILKILIPSWRCKELFHLALLTALLFARTILSIYIADIMGSNAKHLVGRNFEAVKKGVLRFFLLSIPASWVNSMLKYETSMLSLNFRKRISYYLHEEYFQGVNFYSASHLGGSNKIDNADQRVTDDIEKFCSALSNLYANIFKPVLDVVLFTRKLSKVLGFKGPLLMYGYYVLTSLLLRSVIPPFPKLYARESELEGNFRSAHQRIITNAEEISFYDGGQREKHIINTAFNSVFAHSSYVHYLKCLVDIFDGFLVKYGASMIGYLVLCLPIFFDSKKTEHKSTSMLTQDYVLNSQLLVNLARAIGSLVLIYKRITALAGYTSRVSELLEMLNHLKTAGRHPFTIKEAAGDVAIKTVAKSDTESEVEDNDNRRKLEIDEEWFKSWKSKGEAIRERKTKQRAAAARNREREAKLQQKQQPTVQQGGVLIEGDYIKFEGVSLVSPEGRLLVKDLNFEVRPEQNVMITGPNGSGKSSLFRILGELWPLYCGTVIKPHKNDIFYVPQKPYLVLGTLRDQIIYPHSHQEMKNMGITDSDLEKLLELVDPARGILNQWKWDDVKDWLNTFSGGQKQRVAMARVFYHRPKYAILDECTSAVSHEVEGRIYETCAKLGITLFTVSHRESLRKYHNCQLTFDGEGNWHWEENINNNKH